MHFTMTDRTQFIVKAAERMFSRYGYAKTTMSDIASEAGVARQTVYNTFANKEEVLRAVVLAIGESTLAKVQSAWTTTGDLSERLKLFQDFGPVAWFEAVKAAPDSAALIEGLNSAASDHVVAMQEASLEMLLGAIAADGEATPRVPVEDIVEFFYTGSLNAKHGAADVTVLRRRLDTIREATLALLGR